jgi:hypothetical protein
MAYPTIDAPYGLKPINLIGGQVFAGSTRNFPVLYNYATAMFYGDFVTVTGGVAVLATAPINTTNTTVGVFLGCYYTSPATKQRLFSQYYPGGVAAGDITAVVGDDPDVVYRSAVTTAAGATTIGSGSSLLVNFNMVGNTLTGNAATGNSAGAVVGASATSATGGFRVMGLVPESQITTSATYVSGGAPAGTAVVVSGLTVGQVIPVGTDIFNVVSTGGLTGQLQFIGATVATAVTVSSATAQSITTSAISLQAVGTLALVQSPEVLVKVNFNVHRYNIAA